VGAHRAEASPARRDSDIAIGEEETVMAGQSRHQDSGRLSRVFAWLAAIIVPVAMVNGFAHASASQQAEVVTEVVTQHRTVGLADLASERTRLNRVKRHLNDRKDELARRQHALAARKAALDRRERKLFATGSAASAQPQHARHVRTERQSAMLCPSRC
jgi:septal ring factor EnvC (AmiA/AmiB activator)